MCIQQITSFLQPAAVDNHHSNYSWEHCYFFFRNYRNLYSQKRKQNLDLACLHLGFYLASWGMLRNSFLRWKDYKIHQNTITVLMQDQFEELWDVNYTQVLNNGQIIEKIVDLIFVLKKHIITSYSNNIVLINGQNRQPSVSDTLVTKIILGTMGCIPAYDRYFKIGINRRGLNRANQVKQNSEYASFNRDSLTRVIDFVRENFPPLQKIIQAFQEEQRGNQRIDEYPLMKFVDMYFVELGQA